MTIFSLLEAKSRPFEYLGLAELLMEPVSHPGRWQKIFPDIGKACDLFLHRLALPIHRLSSVCCFQNKFLPNGP